MNAISNALSAVRTYVLRAPSGRHTSKAIAKQNRPASA